MSRCGIRTCRRVSIFPTRWGRICSCTPADGINDNIWNADYANVKRIDSVAFPVLRDNTTPQKVVFDQIGSDNCVYLPLLRQEMESGSRPSVWIGVIRVPDLVFSQWTNQPQHQDADDANVKRIDSVSFPLLRDDTTPRKVSVLIRSDQTIFLPATAALAVESGSRPSARIRAIRVPDLVFSQWTNQRQHQDAD